MVFHMVFIQATQEAENRSYLQRRICTISRFAMWQIQQILQTATALRLRFPPMVQIGQVLLTLQRGMCCLEPEQNPYGRREIIPQTARIPSRRGTNFLRVTYPAGNTWQFNMTGIDLEGGEGELVDLALFKLGEHAGVIDQSAKTVNITVPSSMDVKNITPEILASTGASVKPEGPQDFTKPVTYTVSNGQVQKTYQVTVNRGVNVTFHPYGGSINGSTQAITNFISQGSKVTAPSAQPVRERVTSLADGRQTGRAKSLWNWISFR